MTYQLELTEIAEEEFWDAVDWYDAQKDRLGREFAQEMQELIRLIKENPKRFPKAMGEKHKAVFKRFPFIIFYEIHGDTVYILAIFHTRRNPKIWQQR